MDKFMDNKYEVKEYLRHFSSELSEKIKNYAIDRALLHSRYIFVKTVKDVQYGYCTHCKSTFQTANIRAYSSGAWTKRGKLRHNYDVHCPICNSVCKVKHESYSRKNLCDRAYFVYYEKSVVDPEVITARGIVVTRDYRNDFKDVETHYKIPFLYVFKIGKAVMLRENNIMGYEKCRTVYTGYKNFCLSSIRVLCSYESIHKAVENTPFQYSPYKRFLSKKQKYIYLDDMVEFFAKFCRFPVIEILDKIGFEKIVNEKIENLVNYGNAINWRARSIEKIFRLNKQDYSNLKSIAKSIKIDSMFVKLYQMSVNDGSKLKPSEINEIKKLLENVNFDTLLEIYNYSKNIRKTFNFSFLILNYFHKSYLNIL